MENSILATNIEVHVIHDSRRQERYESFTWELQRQGIKDYIVWPCIMINSVVDSIAESHKMIVRDAKERGLNMVCIMEDDVMFPSEKGFEYFLSCMPFRFDLYAAGNYGTFHKGSHSGAIPCDYITGFHCYIIHSWYYDKFLATEKGQHIDTAQQSKFMFSCHPMAALQRPGFSINAMGVVNYNAQLKESEVYGKIIP